jgi:hypothetical protein
MTAPDAVAELLTRSTRRSGVPVQVDDPTALARIAAVVGGVGARRDRR